MVLCGKSMFAVGLLLQVSFVGPFFPKLHSAGFHFAVCKGGW